MQLLPEELALANLRGQITEDKRGYMPHKEASQRLKQLSGKDYGTDLSAWSNWVESHLKDSPKKI